MSNTNESSGNASNSNTKRVKLTLNDGDDRYAYVKWSSGKDKYDVVKMCDIVKADSYAETEEHKLKYADQKFYKATILFIGNLNFTRSFNLNIRPSSFSMGVLYDPWRVNCVNFV